MVKRIIHYWRLIISHWSLVIGHFTVYRSISVSKRSFPIWKARLLSSFSQILQKLKFQQDGFKFARYSPPLAGVGGWNIPFFLKFHPLPPASGGNTPCKPKDLGINLNISHHIKQHPTFLVSRLHSSRKILFFCGLFCISSCSLLDPEEQLPAYLEINNFELTTSPAQGESAAQITDAWVFVNDLSLGLYELPATVPVLNLGNQNITIFPVIRENGLRNTPIIYPLYNRYQSTVELMANQTITIHPTTTYDANAVFELEESFNGSNHLLKGTNENAVISVDGVGKILLGDNNATEFTSSNTFTDLPTSGGLPVFLEIDYKNNVAFEIGLVGISNTINATSYKVTLCPINRWNKVYINFQEDLQVSQLPSYKLAFRVSTDDLDCGGAAEANPEVLIDNVKFIRLKN